MRMWESSNICDVGGRIILKWISRSSDVKMWIGFMWLRMGTTAGSYEDDNEHLGSVKMYQFLE
jgi:hypothetical protein